MKLYCNGLTHQLTHASRAVVEFSQQKDVELVIVTEEMNNSEEFKAKRAHGKFPMLELDDGTMIFESYAIVQHLARRSASHAGTLMGYDAFEKAKVTAWINWGAAHLAWQGAVILYTTCGVMQDFDAYNAKVKELKDNLKQLDKHLQGKTFLMGNRLTVADMTCFVPLVGAFAFALDPGFRKAHQAVSDWFLRVASQSCMQQVCGNVKMCEKALKPVDVTKLPKPEDKPKVEEKVEAKPDSDEDDLFGDDDDEEAEKAKQERFKEIAKTAKSYGKVVIAKSLIIFEVKPWGEETDLDEMGKKILEINMDGLWWKTEYKKEPIAYGVFKLVIGATIQDDLCSTDLLQEKIEELEDLVQSVDIAAFNKL
jgi:glutathione S-transferase/translation elongation factor EF-1beta